MKDLPILIVEDNPKDYSLLDHAFRAAEILNELIRVPDGAEAIAYLSGTGAFAASHAHPLPSLVITDFDMPRLNGLVLLRWIRHHPALNCLPVIMFSSSAAEGDINRAYEAGVNSFVVKPNDTETRIGFARAVKQYWLLFNRSPSALQTENWRATTPETSGPVAGAAPGGGSIPLTEPSAKKR